MAGADSTTAVVCDAGPLIHLDELNCLDLLADFREALVCHEVWNEVARHRPSALRRRRIRLRHLPPMSPTDARISELAKTFALDPGELAALQYMSSMPDANFLTDDAAARVVAATLNVDVHGTIGVVVRALRRGQRTKRQVLNLLKAIPQRSTLYIS